MKLKAELDGVQAVFQKNIDQIKAYAPNKVFENRLAWDCLRAFVGTEVLCSWYDKYGCHDVYIETVGRAALKNLGVI